MNALRRRLFCAGAGALAGAVSFHLLDEGTAFFGFLDGGPEAGLHIAASTVAGAVVLAPSVGGRRSEVAGVILGMLGGMVCAVVALALELAPAALVDIADGADATRTLLDTLFGGLVKAAQASGPYFFAGAACGLALRQRA